MTEIKGDYYPRKAALLQEEEIRKLQVQVNLLRTENAALKEKLAQYKHGRPMSEAPRYGRTIFIRDSTSGLVYDAWWSESRHHWYLISEKLFCPDDMFDRWWPRPGGAE